VVVVVPFKWAKVPTYISRRLTSLWGPGGETSSYPQYLPIPFEVELQIPHKLCFCVLVPRDKERKPVLDPKGDTHTRAPSAGKRSFSLFCVLYGKNRVNDKALLRQPL
jgi:hypothetical protein